MNNFEDLKSPVQPAFSFGIGKAIFYSILAVFAMQIIGGIITIPGKWYPILNNLLLPLGFLIGILGAIGLLLGILKINSRPILKDIRSKFSVTELVLCLFIWIGFLPLTEYFTTLIPTDGAFEELYNFFKDSFLMLLDYKIAGFIMVCLFAPIFEEILFRGIILKGMLNHRISPAVAIAINGVIFGSAHMNPWQFVGAGILGAIFGFVYYRTKSLFIPIILHATNNIVSYVLMMQYQDMEEMVFDTSNYISIGIFALLSLTICLILFRVTQKKNLATWN